MLVLILIAFCGTLIYLSQRNFSYWKKKHVKYIKPIPFFGNYGDYILQKRNIGEAAQNICKKLPEEPIVGAFYGTKPVLIVQDPNLIKLITTKDFYFFNGREVSEYTHKEILSRNVFFTFGDHWKILRQNLSPLFTPIKMKNMFHLIEECSRVFEGLLDDEVSISKILEVRHLMARFTMDSLCSCTFGIDTKAMKSDVKDNPFQNMINVIFDLSRIRAALSIFRAVWPSVFYGLGLKLFPAEIYNFFKSVLMKVCNERSGVPQTRQDFVDLMLELKNNKVITGNSIHPGKGKIDIEADEEFLVAQCVAFFAAGFETSATASAFTLFELAKHPDIQDHVLTEVDTYLTSRSVVKYDCVSELPFLEQCIDEALRLYPALPVVTREVYEDYVLPSGIILERGLRIHLPILHIQRNPKYFENPDEFHPERFNPDVKNRIIPYTFMPFGEGPRNCIGLRFAKMQMIAGLVTLLKKYRVQLPEGTSPKVEFEPTSMITQSKFSLNLKLVPRERGATRGYKVAST